MNRKIRIENLILKNYKPEYFSVLDVSEQHKGHQNYKEDIESHFEIIIVSEKFKNLNRIDRHRMVYDAMGELMKHEIHALSMKTLTKAEWEK